MKKKVLLGFQVNWLITWPMCHLSMDVRMKMCRKCPTLLTIVLHTALCVCLFNNNQGTIVGRRNYPDYDLGGKDSNLYPVKRYRGVLIGGGGGGGREMLPSISIGKFL